MSSLLAGPCPFCSTPLILAGVQEDATINAVIPFQMTADDARQRLSEWFRDMPSAPEGIDQISPSRVTGMYLPYHKIGFGGPGPRDQDNAVARSACAQLDGFLGQGDQLEAIWRRLPLRPFHPDYLSGFLATRPQTGRAETVRDELSAIKQIPCAGRSPWRSTGGGKLAFDDGWAFRKHLHLLHFDHCLTVLAPVWLMQYRWRGQRFLVAICGWSGKVLGQRPREGVEDAIMVGKLFGLGAQAMYVSLFAVILLAVLWEIYGG